MNTLINRIAFSFARNLRRVPRGSLTHPPSTPDPTSLEQQLDQDIEPLSYDKQVQESLKAKVVEQLKNYEGEDPNPHKLVHRPSKGAAWGLGGQLMLASRKVQLQGLKPEADPIIEFLQLHQVKNIYLHDFFASNPDKPDSNRRRYHIIGSCFSAKHCWKTGIELKNAFNLNSGKSKLKRRQVYDPIFAVMNGGKDEEWVLVEFKDYEVSLMTEEQREATDLEWKWNHPVSEEVIEKHLEMKLMRKGRKRQFEDLD